LLFDVMDTLVHDPFFVEVPAFFGMTLTELLHAKHRSAWIDFELDACSEAELLQNFFSDGRTFDSAGLKETMRRAYRWMDGMEPLLASLLRMGVQMHAMSNYPRWFQMIEDELGLGRYLSWTFVSCKTGLRKPAVAAFEHAAQCLGRAPGECVVIDDRQSNCVGAQTAKMRSIRFVDAEQTARRLRDEFGFEQL
jgi:HAD superfamily hydrolase (TIGR01509 family)